MRGVMPLWTSQAVAAATGGIASADFPIGGVAFDSREVGRGDLFVAMPGTDDDGHRFVAAALERGAVGALVSAPVAGAHIRVEDTARALDRLGVAARRRTGAKIVGITGSVGKTGTKEALAAALARTPDCRVHRSIKSYNNHTGVPLSLARMPQASDFGVFELGMNHSGEIAALTKLVRPDVAVITAIAPAHIEFFDSIEGIVDAKGEIFTGLTPGGTAIIPFDSPYRDRLIDHARAYAGTVLTFGSGDGADIRARDAIERPTGTTATVCLPDAELCLTIGQPGAHWLSNGLAVLAAVHALGADLGVAALALADLQQIAGRGARLMVTVGGGEALVIDESYNANPTSMAATLAMLSHEPGRKLVVLGAMRELGHHSDAMHAALADAVITTGVACAVLVGTGIEALADALRGKVEAVHVADVAGAQVALIARARAGDAILIKGSNAIGLSVLVAALKSGVA